MNDVDRFFVDTNIVLYSVDAAQPDKQRQARANAERKLRLERRVARELVATLGEWQSVEMSLGLVQRAWHWMDRAPVAYWDGLILAAAEQAGCSWLLSEDFQPGRRYGAVTVINPLLRRPEEFGLKPARRR